MAASWEQAAPYPSRRPSRCARSVSGDHRSVTEVARDGRPDARRRMCQPARQKWLVKTPIGYGKAPRFPAGEANSAQVAGWQPATTTRGEVPDMAVPARRHTGDTTSRATQPVRRLPADPFGHFDDIYQRMAQMMRSFGQEPERAAWAAPMDIEETEDEYMVEVDLPGVNRDDLSLEWNERQLAIHGEVKERERKGFLRQQGRPVGEFHYTMTLPGDVDGDKIQASLRDGVLTVHAPKAAAAKSRKIEIGQDQSTG